jgi:S1-C subfamily serine protease
VIYSKGNSMLKAVFKLILSATLGMFVLFGANLKDYYYRNQIGGNVVRIYNLENTSGGTGFHIKTKTGNMYILTNKHVCELANKENEVLVEQNKKQEVRKVLKKYEDHDLCLVQAMEGHTGYVEIAKDEEVGEDIIVVGHPGLRPLTLSHGEHIGHRWLQLTSLVDTPEQCEGELREDPMAMLLFRKFVCIESFYSGSISSPIYGGNSGSPVVNKWGRLVGVVFAGNRTQSHDAYMVPLSYVKDFLKGM